MLNASPESLAAWQTQQVLRDFQSVGEIHYDRCQDDEHSCRHCVAHPDFHLLIAEQVREAMGPLWVHQRLLF
jgi:hypothetical protein